LASKYKQEDPAVVRARLEAKFASMRKRMFTDADRKGVCIRCDAPLRPGVTNQMLHDGEGVGGLSPLAIRGISVNRLSRRGERR
jgi:hypothetical protein